MWRKNSRWVGLAGHFQQGMAWACMRADRWDWVGSSKAVVISVTSFQHCYVITALRLQPICEDNHVRSLWCVRCLISFVSQTTSNKLLCYERTVSESIELDIISCAACQESQPLMVAITMFVCFFQRRDHCLLMMHYYSFLTYTLALLDFLAHCTPVRFVKKFLCACNQCQVALTWRLFNSNISVSAVVLTCPDIPLSFCLLQLCGRCTENTREKLQTVSTSWLCVSSTDSSFEM